MQHEFKKEEEVASLHLFEAAQLSQTMVGLQLRYERGQ